MVRQPTVTMNDSVSAVECGGVTAVVPLQTMGRTMLQLKFVYKILMMSTAPLWKTFM